ncbi:MAG: pyridoxamine 5'-phosphate oxidase family protein [Candidatus Bathyarchaeota archaeon]|nr:pyridoxamine 5'-phosphate oxidase family protein [Candidatus Termiticorpusculum sp.]MCL2868607.1 pyridoxamine 5'-phosphate oxidase family protein [Candidatus Termiticorpusculum sp.]
MEIKVLQKGEIFEIINRNPVLFLATIEGAEPRVRGMMLYKADELGIVFHTGPHKDVYHQIIEKPNVQMCFYDATQNIQIRVRGTLEKIDDKNIKEEIANHPTRAFMQNWKAKCATQEEFYKMFSVFRLKNGKANVWTFQTNFAPKEDIQL